MTPVEVMIGVIGVIMGLALLGFRLFYKRGWGVGYKAGQVSVAVYHCRCACCHERFMDNSFSYICHKCRVIADKVWVKMDGVRSNR